MRVRMAGLAAVFAICVGQSAVAEDTSVESIEFASATAGTCTGQGLFPKAQKTRIVPLTCQDGVTGTAKVVVNDSTGGVKMSITLSNGEVSELSF